MITLRDLVQEDLDALVRWRNDSRVNRYLSDRLKKLDETEVWFDRVRSDPKVWLKAIIEDDRMIGYAGVESIDEMNRKCELALVIGETDCWGRGVATGVLRQMLRYSFETLGMHRVWAVVVEGNERSGRLVKGAGFEHEGTMRQAIMIGGRFADLHIYSLLEEEYKAQWIE